MMPHTTFLPDAHRYEYDEGELSIILDRFREDSRDGLIAEATITTACLPNPGLLYHGRINLSSTRSQQEVVRSLEKRLHDVDFQGILQQVTHKSIAQWREGEPSVILADVALEPVRYLLSPYIQEHAVNLLFGDGSSAKSLLALAMGISVATGKAVLGFQPAEPRPVLYLDWEDDASTHRERMDAICSTAHLAVPRNLYYRHMTVTLTEGAAAIRKEIAIYGVGLVILDSVGLAGGQEPERAGTKITLFSGARSLRTTFLGIDHTSKTDSHKPYGSVYTRNIARLVWEAQKFQSEGSTRLTVALRNEKINRGIPHKRQGYHIDYTNELRFGADERPYNQLTGVRFTGGVDIAETALEDTLDDIERIIALLKREGAKTPKEIADALDLKPDNVRSLCNRYKDKRLVKVGEKWGVLAQVLEP